MCHEDVSRTFLHHILRNEASAFIMSNELQNVEVLDYSVSLITQCRMHQIVSHPKVELSEAILNRKI